MTKFCSWAKGDPGAMGRLTPLGVHGDDGQYNAAGDKLIVVTLNFLLAKESPNTPSYGRFPLFTLREFLSLGTYEALQPLLRVLSWSFECLFNGVHPKLDVDGAPYTGRYMPGSPISGGGLHQTHLAGSGNHHRCCLGQQSQGLGFKPRVFLGRVAIRLGYSS